MNIKTAALEPDLAHGAMMSAIAAFLCANLIHNGGTVDAAVIPGGLFATLYVWRRTPVFFWLTAFVIALPAVSFLDPAALGAPAEVRRFANHLALLLAALLSFVMIATFRHERRETPGTRAP